ncbi:MAG: type II secretion system protein [Nautiliaceae bacterium]|jgi:prepilin-type N-terminal cleavage/methylation domain-containing protein
MKNAFTMIELIFVIVILGILASVAIPKLMSTRDDAQTATLTTQLQTANREIISYYTSQGGEINFSEINNSSQVVLNELIHYGWIEVKDDNHSVFYSDRDNKIVCINYYTDGGRIEVEQNNSNNSPLCNDIKRIVKDANYSVLNETVKF